MHTKKKEALTQLETIFSLLLKGYDDMAKFLIQRGSDNDREKINDHITRLAAVENEFSKNIQIISKSERKKKDTVVLPKDTLEKLYQFASEEIEVENEDDIGYIRAQNTVREILSKIK
ncbi:hypothetical protein ACFVQB_14320 [Paenibacillus sp. NPDC057886]|uniref:hypothetical protein n=1 Tax=Paenibacillus sp. NPDC057886 TaxID=3346270 RepID=UPI0036A09B1B